MAVVLLLLPLPLGFLLADAIFLTPKEVRILGVMAASLLLLVTVLLTGIVVGLFRRTRPLPVALRTKIIIAIVLAGPLGLAYSIFLLTARIPEGQSP